MKNSGNNLVKLKNIFCKKYLSNKSTVIAIIGAGCSFVSGMPPWSALKDEIINRIIDCYSDKGSAKKLLWEKTLSKNWDLDPTITYEDIDCFLSKHVSVENICNVACESSIVTESLHKLFQDKYMNYEKDIGPPPQLAYELISHFLKHRYIDHAVNFNFDEILDFAVRNEIGDNEFDLIINEKDILRYNNRYKPRLIKLHGTISLPNTLKFKSDDTLTLSQDIINLFNDTFLIRDDINKIKPIDLVSFGYSWNDYDFANYVYSKNKYIRSISIIQLEKKIPRYLENASKSSKIDINIISLEEITDKKYKNKGVISIDQLLWALWQLIETELKNKPHMPIARHLLLSYLYGNAPKEPGLLPISFLDNRIDPVRRHTIENRFADEISLHLVKCKGMINASVMAYDQRLNRYHSVMIDRKKNFDESPLDKLSCISQSSYPDVKETYFSIAEDKDGLCAYDLPPRVRTDVFIPKFDPTKNCIYLDPLDTDEFIKDCMNKIFDGPEVEIVTRADNRPHWVFLKPKLIESYYELSVITNKLLNKPWNKLFVIAETGEWLIKLLYKKYFEHSKSTKKNHKKDIYMITASAEHLEEWNQRTQIIKELNDEIVKLKSIGIKVLKTEISWWQHNRHLTLAYNSNTNKYYGGIYFRRRLKTSRIVPYYLEDTSDCNELFLTFISHINRIENRSPGDFIKDIIDMIELLKNKMSIKQIHKEKLEKIYQNLIDK